MFSRRLDGVLLSLFVAVTVAGCGSGSDGSAFDTAPDGSATDGSGTDGAAGDTPLGGDSSSSSFGQDSGHADAKAPDAAGDAACNSGVTCASAGANCGPISNGCGGVLQCGTCSGNMTCGGGGMPSKCGTPCVPTTCPALGFNCGPAGDGCGNQLDCGTCTSPEVCGGSMMPGVCADPIVMCTPTTCGALGYNCGPAGDGCGNQLDCGTCTSPQTCGGGGQPSVCGAPPACVPMTCAPGDCGPTADGCGGLLQCGSCTAPETCGGLAPGVCGIPATCTNLCLQQTGCSNPAVTTTITGTVYAPNGTDPLPNVLVYIPNAPVAAFTPGVSCEQCSAGVSGSPLVSAATNTAGQFTLSNVPVGSNIPLVIQTGRWRKQSVIPTVASCTNTAVAAALTTLPSTKAQGDIPHMAFATGSVDALECVMRKIGVADSEFTQPSGTGRINIYVGDGSADGYNIGGANAGNGTPSETALVNSASTLDEYDMVLFPCEGAENDRTMAQQTNVINYANAGGRIFTTHFSYVWLFNDAPFKSTAAWDVSQTDSHTSDGYPPDQNGIINQTFPKGLALAEWLQVVGASTVQGTIPINTLRWDINGGGASVGINSPAQLWMQINDTKIGSVPMHYTFNTPVAAAASAQCGRVLFDDFHVENHGYINQDSAYGLTFPAECAAGAMTAQEKLLEFMIFDLGSCVTPDMPVCTPTTCAQENIQCGPSGDGCGNVLQCGTCPSGQTCGGGGVPSVCGAPMCTPTTCAAQNVQCGPAGDGCGNALSCGTCPSGQSCGGGGMPGVCGAGMCTPRTCAEQNIQCGPAGDGCGNALACGSCPTGQTCGGGGTPGVCGSSCVPKTCAELGFNCGPAGDGCGNSLNCGTCSAPQTCGGGGAANVCGGGVPQ